MLGKVKNMNEIYIIPVSMLKDENQKIKEIRMSSHFMLFIYMCPFE